MSDGGLRPIFRKRLPKFDWLAVETGLTSSGVPDLNYATPDSFEGWIECKACDHWRVTIRPMQVGWIERRLRFNTRVFVAVRRAKDELWLFHGGGIRQLYDRRIDCVDSLYGHWSGGPGRWDWSRIADVLTNGY